MEFMDLSTSFPKFSVLKYIYMKVLNAFEVLRKLDTQNLIKEDL